jgi:hypothetical protein
MAVVLPKSATDPVNKKHLNHQATIHYGRTISHLSLSFTPSCKIHEFFRRTEMTLFL